MRLARALVAAALVAANASAEPYAVGSTLPALTLPDQHGKEQRLDESVRLVLLSRDMDGGGVVKGLLAEGGSAFLAQHHAVYVADVSRMPGLIRRMFALPSMRRRAYPVLLDEDGSKTADFPSAAGKATVLFLDGLRITRVEQVGSREELERVVQPAAR